jgi:hypothetical protein
MPNKILTFDECLSVLDGVHRSSPTSATAKCPCHDDKQASLSVAIGNSGSVLVTCFAGCDFRAIFAALRGRAGVLR